MKTLLLFLAIYFVSTPDWMKESFTQYTLFYTEPDKSEKKAYAQLVDTGIRQTVNFFNAPFTKKFEVYVHPNRASLDAQWQKDWSMPDFKSECWMVASGVATKLDMIAPKAWDKESCEHKYADKIKVQQLITHELVHVYHGQLNVSPDFSDVTGLDWLVEGLATYASGQLDEVRLGEVRKAIEANQIPSALDKFWSGKFKYGLSGSVVWFIDKKFGRDTLKRALKYNKVDDVMKELGTEETDLLRDWKKFVLSN